MAVTPASSWAYAAAHEGSAAPNNIYTHAHVQAIKLKFYAMRTFFKRVLFRVLKGFKREQARRSTQRAGGHAE